MRIFFTVGGGLWVWVPVVLAVEILVLSIRLWQRVRRLGDPQQNTRRGPIRLLLCLLVGLWAFRGQQGVLNSLGLGRSPAWTVTLTLFYGYLIYWAVRNLVLCPGLREGGILSEARLPHDWAQVHQVTRIGSKAVCFYMDTGRSCVLRTTSEQDADSLLEQAVSLWEQHKRGGECR